MEIKSETSIRYLQSKKIAQYKIKKNVHWYSQVVIAFWLQGKKTWVWDHKMPFLLAKKSQHASVGYVYKFGEGIFLAVVPTIVTNNYKTTILTPTNLRYSDVLRQNDPDSAQIPSL